VSFLQSGSAGILCFRGTEATNAVHWLSNASFGLMGFYSWGEIHSGFYQTLMPVLPFIDKALLDATAGKRVANDTPVPGSGGGFSGETSGARRKPRREPKPLEALYITGHGLGGALGVLAAARIFAEDEYAFVREKLRGVYTFGQPLVGDREFCDTCEQKFGHKLVFRHIYRHDVVPCLPPRLYGALRTFGQELVSGPYGWTRRRATAGQVFTQAASVGLGTLDWYALQLLMRGIPLPLRFSLADHMAGHYVRCSSLSLPEGGTSLPEGGTEAASARLAQDQQADAGAPVRGRGAAEIG
jgi:hypothetical protein